jgi:hypothetical protein
VIHAAAARTRLIWKSHERAIAGVAIGLMAVLGGTMVFLHFRVLVAWLRIPVDLNYYYSWIQPWFQGADVYGRPERPEYPPASMALLWPLFGWSDVSSARLLVAGLDAAALVGLTIWFVRASGATTPRARLFVALLCFSMTPTGAAIGNGQLILLVLPFVIGGVTLLVERPPSFGRDLAAAALLTVSLVKPSIAVPFFWLMILGRGWWRPLFFVAAAYAALTSIAAAHQPESVWSLLTTSVANGQRTARMAIDGNVHFLLRILGLSVLMLPVTAAIWFALGWWVWRHRTDPLWLLLAVIGLVARLWTYHRSYDSVLVVFAEIALFRIAAAGLDRDEGAVAGGLLAATVALFLLPGPIPGVSFIFSLACGALHGCITGLDLLFLVYYSERCLPPSCAVTRSTVPA